jgi:hypothetical protein
VPKRFVSGLKHGTRAAAELVAAGLWEPAERNGEPGWIFHDWHDYQPSAEEVEAKREQARERQRRHRELDQEGRFVTRDKRVTEPSPEADVTRESRTPDPTRPDPSLQTPVLFVETSSKPLQTDLRPRAREEADGKDPEREEQKRRRYRPSRNAPVPVGDMVGHMARTASNGSAPMPTIKPKAAAEEPRCKTCYVGESRHYRVEDHPFISGSSVRLVATT